MSSSLSAELQVRCFQRGCSPLSNDREPYGTHYKSKYWLMKCLWSAFYRNENFEHIITSAWNWSHVQSHSVFISFLLHSPTRAVPDHVYSEQNLRLKEIKNQVWALMFHWFSPFHRSQRSLFFFTQLVSCKLLLPIANLSPPSQELAEGPWRCLEHAGAGKGEVGCLARQGGSWASLNLSDWKLCFGFPKADASFSHLAHLQGFSEENRLVHADSGVRLIGLFAFKLLINLVSSSGLFQIQWHLLFCTESKQSWSYKTCITIHCVHRLRVNACLSHSTLTEKYIVKW